MVIDTTRQIAEMPIISLSGVDTLLDKALRVVLDSIFDYIYNVSQTGVDLASETLTG
jgi:uroporphyrinogen-III synthase